MELFIAKFQSYQYPEDTYVLGAFSSEDKAEQAIQSAIETDKHFNIGYSARCKQKRQCYDIMEVTLDVPEYN